MKIRVSVSMGLARCQRSEVIEIDDNTDDAEAEEIARDKLFEMIDWDFKRIDEADFDETEEA